MHVPSINQSVSHVKASSCFHCHSCAPEEGLRWVQSDLELDVLVKLAGDDAVLESVLVDVLVDMLEVDVLEEWDVELLDLQLPGNALGLIINLEAQLKGSHN